MLRDAQHMPAECNKRTVPRRIVALAPVMRTAVDLDGEGTFVQAKSTM